jgi:hypothetical protein
MQAPIGPGQPAPQEIALASSSDIVDLRPKGARTRLLIAAAAIGAAAALVYYFI